ncbi:splicing factor 3B subunit 1-like [Dorcoceras hygrometricum]|uniref:Splicing factor 3B subunit 1-like n=1 Tax=Dorcoceras hygrometricum TaxID=472368 RepID=A0A2Z7AZ92_9LAMI|nr:splicing factor 3B subunit 1-like [Dorcoceras hygrometricum]
MEEPSLTRPDDIVVEDTKCSTSVNDEDDNLDGAENEIARKMTSFTAPKQFLKEPLRSVEDDYMSGSKQPSKIIEPTATEKDKEIEPVATEDFTMELTKKASTSDEESMSLEDLLKQIPDDMMMPSIIAAEPTKIKFGQGIEIREVDLYKASLPRIAADDKGKEHLVVDTIQGHPAREIFSLICADIDFLVQLREQVIEEMKEHKLECTRPYSSHLFEGSNVQPGVFIPRSNTRFESTCWIRAMILVDGSWLIVEGVDYWRPISRPVDSQNWEMLPQRPYIDDLAPLYAFVEPVQDLDSRSPFSRLICDQWTEVCVAVVQFSLLGFFHPVGTVNRCRDIIGPIVDIEEVPSGFRSVFQHGVDTDSFVDFFDKYIVQPYLRTKDSIGDLKKELLSKIDNLEKAFVEAHSQQDQVLRGLMKSVRQEVQIQKTVLSLEMLEFKKGVRAQNVILTTDMADIRKEVQEQKAALSQDMDDKLKGIQDQQAALSHDLMQFRVQAQETLIPSRLSCLNLLIISIESRNPSHSDVGSIHSCAPSPLEACQEPLIVRATSWH